MRQALLQSVAPILAAPWRQRRNGGSLWGLAIVVAVVAIGPVALFCWSLLEQFGLLVDAPAGARPAVELAADLRHTAINVGHFALAVLALGWWAVSVSNLLDQNKPVLARLVPEHPARLRVALLVAWAGALALVTLLVGVRFDAVLACATLAALVLAFVAAAVRWPLLWLLGCVAPLAVKALMTWPGLPAAIETAGALWTAQPMTVFLAVAAFSAMLLMALVQAGDRRHVASDEARRTRVRRFEMRARGDQPVAEGTRGHLDAVLTRPYFAWWRFTLSRPTPPPVFGRVMQGLGPGVHWTTGFAVVVASTIALGLGTAALRAVGMLFPDVGSLAPDLLAAVSVGLLPAMVAPALQVQARLHQSRREQALLVLLPGVPQGAALNRRLACQLSAQFVLAWLAALVVMALGMAVADWMRPGTVGPDLLRLRGLLMLATLPLVIFQWRPWARVAAPTALNALLPVLLGGILVLLGWIGLFTGLFSLATLAVASMGGAVAWCAWRWQRMGREPSAFPLGRLA